MRLTGRRRGAAELELVAHTGLEPVISALRGQRVNQLHQCAVEQQLIIDAWREAWQTTEIKRFRKRFWRLETLPRPIARMLYSQLAQLF
jgi:hypothetical protein